MPLSTEWKEAGVERGGFLPISGIQIPWLLFLQCSMKKGCDHVTAPTLDLPLYEI